MSIPVDKVTLTATDANNNPITFEANRSQNVDCWRLVYNDTQIIDLFQAVGYTTTRDNLFCGTEQECNDLITSLKLKPSDAYLQRKKIHDNQRPPN